MEIEYKNVPVGGVRVVDEAKGIVEAIVSVTGVVDEVKDVIEPGAYEKTLAKRTPKGVWSHAWDKPVAKTLEAKELLPGDPHLPKVTRGGKPWPREAGALLVKMQFNLNTDRGRNAYEDVKFFGDDAEWSVGYQVPMAGASVEQKSGVRRIKTMELYEYSPVLFGAMPMAVTQSVKSAQLAYKALYAALDEKIDPSRPVPPTKHPYVDKDGDGKCDVCGDAKDEHRKQMGKKSMAPGEDAEEDAGVDLDDQDDQDLSDEERELLGQDDEDDVEAKGADHSSRAHPGLDRSPKENWVDKAGGLPSYIERIAKHLHHDRGMTISHAIASAINRVKKWAAGGDNVSAATRAKAAKALAQWEKMKAGKALEHGLDFETKRQFSSSQREDAADAGEALSDGSYPIKNAEDLKNAVQAYGRGKDKAKVKRHIMKRARALGLTDQLPDDWKATAKALAATFDAEDGVEEAPETLFVSVETKSAHLVAQVQDTVGAALTSAQAERLARAFDEVKAALAEVGLAEPEDDEDDVDVLSDDELMRAQALRLHAV